MLISTSGFSFMCFGPPPATQRIHCHYCHLWGHVIRNFWRKKRVDRLRWQSPAASSVVASPDSLHVAIPLMVPSLFQSCRCRFSSVLGYVTASAQASGYAGTPRYSWILHSSASIHMTLLIYVPTSCTSFIWHHINLMKFLVSST